MPDPITPFDRRLLRLRRERAAPHAARFEFLRRHAEAGLEERLLDVKRRFSDMLLLGAAPHLATALAASAPERLVTQDLAASLLQGVEMAVAADEELLPFAAAAFDLVASTLSLHWVNDLPGCLAQIRRVLKPDGFFLATLLGGDTLWELRQVLLQAESETGGGAASRVSPFAGLRDMGALMQRAGFALPVVDGETVTVTYPDLFALMRDLRGMGAAHAPSEGYRPLSRAALFRAAALYAERHSEVGRIAATFQMIHVAGWAPHESQQKPLQPGSAQTRLAAALGVSEGRL